MRKKWNSGKNFFERGSGLPKVPILPGSVGFSNSLVSFWKMYPTDSSNPTLFLRNQFFKLEMFFFENIFFGENFSEEDLSRKIACSGLFNFEEETKLWWAEHSFFGIDWIFKSWFFPSFQRFFSQFFFLKRRTVWFLQISQRKGDCIGIFGSKYFRCFQGNLLLNLWQFDFQGISQGEKKRINFFFWFNIPLDRRSWKRTWYFKEKPHLGERKVNLNEDHLPSKRLENCFIYWFLIKLQKYTCAFWLIKKPCPVFFSDKLALSFKNLTWRVLIS